MASVRGDAISAGCGRVGFCSFAIERGAVDSDAWSRKHNPRPHGDADTEVVDPIVSLLYFGLYSGFLVAVVKEKKS